MGHKLFNPQARSAPDDLGFAETVQSMPAPVDEALLHGMVSGLPPDSGIDSLPMPENTVSEHPTLSHIGRYALKQRLGEGGLGTVYEAWDPLLSRPVAVKTLQFDLDTPARLSLDGLFLNEARLAAGLSHPNIVTIHDAGLSAHGVYIAMERLHGRDMRQALQRGWRPTPEQAAQLVRRVADGLAYAHTRGVVHCDIKPANIFLSPKGKPKLLDFGIARAAHGAALPALDGLVAGSPFYVSPEQLEGGAVDARSDLYSLGVVLYELLTGRKAFDGESLQEITTAVLRGQALPAHEVQPALPVALSAIVARMMARAPADRPESAMEVSLDLRRWVERSAPALTPPRSRRSDKPAEPSGRAARPVPRWLLPAAAIAVVAGVALWAGLRPAATPATPAALPAAAAPILAPEPDAPTTPPTLPPEPAAAHAPPDNKPSPPPPPARERPAPGPAAKSAKAQPPAAVAVVPVATGTLRLAISPWGEVEVNGEPAGTTPPLARLTLPAGTHTVTVRNGDAPAFTTTVDVTADQPVTVRHRF